MGYAAIYPSDALEAHRAWQEFLGHFERRKLALGQCGRAYGSSCVHEHAWFDARY